MSKVTWLVSRGQVNANSLLDKSSSDSEVWKNPGLSPDLSCPKPLRERGGGAGLESLRCPGARRIHLLTQLSPLPPEDQSEALLPFRSPSSALPHLRSQSPHLGLRGGPACPSGQHPDPVSAPRKGGRATKQIASRLQSHDDNGYFPGPEGLKRPFTVGFQCLQPTHEAGGRGVNFLRDEKIGNQSHSWGVVGPGRAPRPSASKVNDFAPWQARASPLGDLPGAVSAGRSGPRAGCSRWEPWQHF